MPTLPGEVKLGQGFPGGSSSLPGEITGAGPPGSIPTSPGFKLHSSFDAPVIPPPTLTPVPKTGTFSTPDPGQKAYKLSTAMALLDQVRQGQMPWQNAQKILKDFSDADRSALHAMVVKRFNQDNQMGKGDIPLPLDELRALSVPGPSGGGILSHLASDTTNLVHGFIPGMALAGKALGSDLIHPSRSLGDSHFLSQVIKPAAKQEEETWGPLVKATGLGYKALGQRLIGDKEGSQATAVAQGEEYSKFGRGVSAHPLGPLLDTLAVASAGIGTAGRVAAASRAMKVTDVSRGADGVAQIGAKAGLGLKIYQNKAGTWSVRDRGQIVASRFPDEKSAIAHAQSLTTGGLSGSAFKVAMKAATQRGPKGNLIEAYENARGITHADEHQQIIDEVTSVLEDPNLRTSRRTGREVIGDVASDLRATRQRGLGRVDEIANNLPSFISPEGFRLGARAGATALTLMQESSDLVRAGAVYVRPGYLPNNWAGNTFMNAVQQGVYAPINLAKSLVMDKEIGVRYTRAIDQSMGANAAQVITGSARGYISSVMQPMAHVMGALADQPFRRASWLHEARRMGYENLPKVKQLMDRAAGGDQAALQDIAVIARKASEEIVKFGHMNEVERGILRNLVFVYSWMRGATRYAARFPFAHPIQTAMFNQEAHQGNDWLAKNMGGVPSFLVGAIPIGHDRNGNPILINPFSLNPLGTGLQVAAAAQGTYNVIQHPDTFNKFASTDAISLLNPLAQSYLAGREGGKPLLQGAEQSIAAVRLAHDLQHPESGGIYPTSREEAVGHFVAGSLYPRQADQAAITKSLERENSNHPLALIPEQLKTYKKLTGEDVPPEMVAAYQADVIASQQEKDFQRSYASAHGQSGFKNLPAQNRAEAALEFLKKHKLMTDRDIASITNDLKSMKTDAEFNDLANSLWSSTGTGSAKRAWQQLMTEAKSQQLTRKRR